MDTEKNWVQRIIEEVDEALDNKMYFSALSLMLTIPDICSKHENPEKENTGLRYKEWFDTNLGQYNRSPDEKNNAVTPHINGELIYRLRCAMLHQVSNKPNLDKAKDYNKLSCFVMTVESRKYPEIYADSASYDWFFREDGEKEIQNRKLYLNIRQLWRDLKLIFERYCEDHSDLVNDKRICFFDKDERKYVL